jgi:hypothetical protein
MSDGKRMQQDHRPPVAEYPVNDFGVVALDEPRGDAVHAGD